MFLLFVVYFWLTEFRTRAHSLRFNNNSVFIAKFFRLGKTKCFDFKDLEGFEILIQTAKSIDYEYLFIIKEGERVACLSQFYHTNYEELKLIVVDNLIYLGDRKYDFKSELIAMFK
ncbi:hypothetical protein ABS764_09050 [Flavobacterium sp. ST-87]|uniref:Uncharacterized protein n=1 Tax=Flavobacterium plantiphilum TaxID=3163297 RepID=A0ABW8XTA0_9FLAO